MLKAKNEYKTKTVEPYLKLFLNRVSLFRFIHVCTISITSSEVISIGNKIVLINEVSSRVLYSVVEERSQYGSNGSTWRTRKFKLI